MRHQSVPLSAALIATLLAAALPLTALAAPAWYGATGGFISNGAAASVSLPDFYQHQDWVSDGTALTFGPPPANLLLAPTNPTNGWETGTTTTGGTPAGWCNYTAYADIFYDFYTRGFTTIFPNATVNPVTNPYTAMYGASTKASDVAQSDILQLRVSMGSTDAGSVQKYLTAQNTGLISNALTIGQGGAQLAANGNPTTVGSAYYIDPTSKKLMPLNLSIFDSTNLLVKHLGADIVYTMLSGTAAAGFNANGQGLWWAGSFHNVALAGINTADSSVYVADPDTNGGPTTTSGGWPVANVNFPAKAPFNLASPVGSPLPVPAAPAAATPATYNTFYDKFQFGQGGAAANVISSTDAPQYNRTILSNIGFVMPNPIKTFIDSLKTTKAAGDPPTATDAAIDFQLPTGADSVDKIFIEPSQQALDPSTEPGFDSLTVPADSSSIWTDHLSATDPLGDTLTDPGIEYDLSGADPLIAGEDADIDLGTVADTSSSYDILMHFAGDPANDWLPYMSANTDIVADQSVTAPPTPEPASLTLLALGTLTLATRKKSPRS